MDSGRAGELETSLNLLSEPLFQDSEGSPNTEGSEVILGKTFGCSENFFLSCFGLNPRLQVNQCVIGTAQANSENEDGSRLCVYV